MPIKKGPKRNVDETDGFVNKVKKSNMKETFKSKNSQKQATCNKKDTKESVKSKSIRNSKKVVGKKQNAKPTKIVSKKKTTTNVRSKVSKNPARKK